MDRHRTTTHRQTEELFWCSVSDCTRSEGFLDEKRPFLRKDEFKDHMRKVHGKVLLPTVSSASLAAVLPAVVDNVTDDVLTPSGGYSVTETVNSSSATAQKQPDKDPRSFRQGSPGIAELAPESMATQLPLEAPRPPPRAQFRPDSLIPPRGGASLADRGFR